MKNVDGKEYDFISVKESKKSRELNKWLFLFVSLWLVNYIAYPIWLLPESYNYRLLLFTLFLVYFLGNGWFLSKYIPNRIDLLESTKIDEDAIMKEESKEERGIEELYRYLVENKDKMDGGVFRKLKSDLKETLFKTFKEKSISSEFFKNYFLKIRELNNKITNISYRNSLFYILIIICLVVVLVQIYPMTLPITTRGDECYHFDRGARLYEHLASDFENATNLSFSNTIRILFGSVSFLIAFYYLKKVQRAHRFDRWIDRIKKKCFTNKKIERILAHKLFGITLFTVLLYAYFLIMVNSSLARDHPSMIVLVRFPPISAIIYFFEITLFGYSEFGVRLAQVIFSMLTAVFTFRLTLLYRDDCTAFLASVLILFFPIFFCYSHLAYLEPGSTFLAVISSFYFLKYTKNKQFRDLLFMSFFISCGVLYKRPNILMLFIILAFIIFSWIKSKEYSSKELKKFLGISYFILVPVAPWIIIGYEYVWRNYVFTPSNWTSPSIALSYLMSMPEQITYPLFILFLIGVAYGLLFKRDTLTTYSIIWFCVWYGFFTSDKWVGVPRLIIPYYPAVAIIVAQFIIDFISKLCAKKLLRMGIISIFPIYLILSSTILPSNISGVSPGYVTYIDLKSRYVPYDQALYYIKYNLSPENKLLITMGPNPFLFYKDKYNVLNEYDARVWADPSEQTILNLHSYCIKNNIDYVLFPTGECLVGYVNISLVNELSVMKDGPFMLLEAFVSGSNKMILSKVNKTYWEKSNIAVRGNISVSSTFDSRYEPKFAIDNNMSTRWASRSNLGEGAEIWLEINWIEPQKISKMILECFSTDTCPLSYKLQYYDHGEWRTILDRDNNIQISIIEEFSTIETNRIRLLCEGGKYGVSLWEFKLITDV